MSEKRFKYEYGLIWNENGEKFDVNECEGRRLVCDKLNEQQSTIQSLKEENKRLIKEIKSKNKIIELYYEMVRLNE